MYRSASACGLCRVGGIDNNNVDGLGDPAPVDGVAALPGYGGCGGPPWLSASPSRLIVAPGRTAKVTVTLNAASPSVGQPGTYAATLQFSAATPYRAPTVAVGLAAAPPASWGRLAGSVAGRACDGTTTPLAGATVQISGRDGTWAPTTDRQGRYSLWLDDANSPATLIVSQPGWQPQTATAPVTPQATTTRNFTLTPAGGCR